MSEDPMAAARGAKRIIPGAKALLDVIRRYCIAGNVCDIRRDSEPVYRRTGLTARREGNGIGNAVAIVGPTR